MVDINYILNDLLRLGRPTRPDNNPRRRPDLDGDDDAAADRVIIRRRNDQARRRFRLIKSMVCEQQQARSETIINIAIFISGVLAALCAPAASIWSRNRSTQWWDIDCLMQYDDQQWYANFRMTRGPFHLLCNQLHPHIVRMDTRMRRPVSVIKLVAMTLYRLATGESFRTISNLFGVGMTTAYEAFWDVCIALCTNLKPMYVKRPKGDEVQRMLQIFEHKFGFPMCGGAIDGSHIPIIAPKKYHTDYYNRKGWYSVVLQGLVDHEYKFIDFDVGHPGKCHDAYVYESSKLFKKLTAGTFYPPLTKTIDNKEIPIVLLGDSAYPLSKFLMKPYPEGLANQSQKRFNERLSRTRIIVEHTFGRLKGRWRSIMKRNDTNSQNIHIVVTACIVLHNFCEIWNMDYEEHVDNGLDQPAGNEYHPDENAVDENQIRSTLTQYFINHPY
ncbi:uncharacterized protein [Antedon mediterranea]|uniref:uncharacterized protein n=1 Tax=Antedon mediterranea TaxID=105859 RepID=UPI003AF47667